LRQNDNDGSTLELEVELPNQPVYQTAGNVALYSRNDPILVSQAQTLFNIAEEDMDRPLGLTKVNPDKKLKLNFVPKTVRSLLEESIDLQGKLSKSLLKKLSKLESSNPNYFSENSLKTTEEFQRLT
jgi:sulfite reductase alpha subunit-like flavoprotein